MVTLRAKKLSSGKFHLFIDVYENGQRRKEYLKLYVSEDYTQPQTDKKGNVLFDSRGQAKLKKPKTNDLDVWELAQKIRLKQELALKSKEYGFTPAFKRNANFTDYFTKYVDGYNRKDKRKAIGCLTHYNTYNQDRAVLCSHVNEEHVEGFKEYLIENLTGETPAGYFRHFKAAMKKAHKEGLLKTNFAEDVKIRKITAIKKDVLTFTEIQKLSSTPANNDQVKRAFLFSCLTGLRFGDITQLKWSNIQETESGLILSIKQGKTNEKVNVNLNADAIRFLGERGESKELVFMLPSHTGVLKSLRTWTKEAEVKKKVTFHVARHSFATNLIYYGADIKTASSLLGHKNLNQTNLYVRVVESLKEKAVSKLPQLIV